MSHCFIFRFDTLQMECCVYQGGKALSKRAYSPHAKLSRNFFKAVVWNKWMNMCVPLSSLPPESRVLFTLHGLEFPGSGSKWSRTPIAWAILRLFDCEGCVMNVSRTSSWLLFCNWFSLSSIWPEVCVLGCVFFIASKLSLQVAVQRASNFSIFESFFVFCIIIP